MTSAHPHGLRKSAFAGALLALFVIVLLGLTNCTDHAHPNPAPAGPPPVDTASVDGLIGPEGGTLTHPAGAEIVVPPGALAAPIRLTLSGVAPPSAAELGGAVLGQGFEAGPEGQAFLKPVQVILPFDPTRIPAGSDVGGVQMRMAPHGSTSFAALQSTVDLASRRLAATTVHFTQFVPAQTPNPVFIATTPALPQGTVGIDYLQQLAALGGSAPYTWILPAGNAVPPGLGLTTSGSLAGTPTVPSAFAFFIAAADSANHSVQLAFSLTILPSANPVPVLTQVNPNSALQGSRPTAITLAGTGFVPTSQALWDGTALATAFVSATSLGASIPAKQNRVEPGSL